MGPVEKVVRDDVEELGDLVGVEPSLAQMAYRLAQVIDGLPDERCAECGTPVPATDARTLPQLNRELRQTLAQLVEGRGEEDDDDLGDLAEPS
ncbi:hypothetical protein [Nonomuraea ceibae]|uniref:hypothetical protein n=1 Tax=Nonomuraea ceibae TaxID=1935170 RepID=UPI001C5F7BED|nr:hypothetical protein [Nonomuraea ceibae]